MREWVGGWVARGWVGGWVGGRGWGPLNFLGVCTNFQIAIGLRPDFAKTPTTRRLGNRNLSTEQARTAGIRPCVWGVAGWVGERVDWWHSHVAPRVGPSRSGWRGPQGLASKSEAFWKQLGYRRRRRPEASKNTPKLLRSSWCFLGGLP